MHRLVVAVVTLLTLTGAAVVGAYLFLFAGGTDAAARLAPAQTAAYVNVYLQPSTGQQMNLAELIGRLPGFADDASLDEKVDQIVQNLLAGTGVDYRADIKPWLGDQVAVAAWPASGDPADSDAVVIAAVKDADAARSSIANLATESGATLSTETYAGLELQVGDGSAYAFIDGMLVAGSSVDGVHAVIDTSQGADALAGRPDFREAMSELPVDYLASVFVDVAAITDAAGAGDQIDGPTIASAVLVAERDGLRLSGSAPLPASEGPSASAQPAAAGDPSSLVEWMPATTIAEISTFGLRSTLEDAEAAVGAAPGGADVTGALDTLRAIAALGLGIDLDAEVLPLLDREVALAVTGLEGDLPAAALLLRPADADAAADALDRVAQRLGSIGGSSSTQEVEGTDVTVLSIPDVGDLAYAVVDEVVVIGLGVDDVSAALDAHASGTSLAASETYRRTFEVAGTRAGTEMYVDVGALAALIAEDPTLPSDARDILLSIGSFGLTVPTRDGEIEFHAVLTVDEP